VNGERLRAGSGDLYSAVRVVERLIHGRVRDCVLIANLMREVERDVVDLVEVRGIVDDAAGGLREPVQLMLRLPGFRRVLVIQQADGVDRHAALFRQPLNLRGGAGARVVVAVGDDEQDAAIPRRMLRQIPLAGIDCVAHRRSANRVDPRQIVLERAYVARHRHVDAHFVGEVHDEHLVERSFPRAMIPVFFDAAVVVLRVICSRPVAMAVAIARRVPSGSVSVSN